MIKPFTMSSPIFRRYATVAIERWACLQGRWPGPIGHTA